MRYLGKLLLLVVLITGLAGSSASAETQSISQSVTLSGEVAAAKYAELDAAGNIMRVVSNSEGEADVHFYVLDGKNTPVEPTDQQMQAYLDIKAKFNLNKVGIVYDSAADNSPVPPTLAVSNTSDTRQIKVESSLQAVTFVFY